tara:strand:+ start:8638 stop:22557 length:13920 start_codon:yes stop_codon:yes gene_type:complete
MALTRVTSGGIAPGIVIKFDSDNTPTNPAISFDGDTNTGMYQPADDEIAFSTAGVERFRIKADGNIVAGNGTIIGGTNPDFDNAVNVVLYVNQSDKNATDSIDNDGGNLLKPFKTIERALLEAANKSEVAGAQDRFEAFTIMVLPGDYEIDNRPGYDVINNPVTGLTDAQFQNNLYRFNPRNGGVIVPRGTSIVGYDLRKTVIRPKYVPTPTSDEGSIDEGLDYYQIGSIFYDGARMIEKARGYIVEQAYLKIEDDYSLSVSNINAKCKRDIGYFVDGIIADLRGGGNSNSFVVGEWYTLGQNDDGVNETSDITSTDSDGQGAYLKSPQEVTATKAAFNRCRDIINAFLDYAKRDYFDSGESEYNATNITGYYTETTSGKTVVRPTFATNVDYNGSGDCSDVQDAVTALTAVVTGILDAPDTFNDTIKKTLPVTFQTSIFKVTGGCYFWQMTFKDAKTNPYNKVMFSGSGVPTFTQASSTAYSHHRVVAFSYADQRSVDGELERYYRRIDAWVGGTREARIEEYRIVGNSELKTQIDTVNGCSPYIFNCSLRSVLGLCGMHTDGSKVKENSFKSMVVAQYTGISLQRDPDAYWQPNNKTGKVYTSSPADPSNGDSYTNVATAADSNTNRGAIFADPDAEYKHDWRHFHIKASNGAFIQVVSVFAVGYADQFLSVNGGDMSITNSNSNFGQISLRAAGNKFKPDPPSAYGKITAVIPPAGISKETRYAEIYPISAKSTRESNLGESATKAEPDWINAKAKFGSPGNDYFKLFLEIPGVQDEDEIPELVVESVDNKSGNTIVRRFLTFGSNNNFNLFRDYYDTEGRLNSDDCQIVSQVDSNSGGLSTYRAVIYTDTPADDGATDNHERVGYYWDTSEKKVYLKLNPNKPLTQTYINEFIFSTVVETSFITVTETNDDGSTTVVSKTEDVNVLKYWDSYPGSITSPKLADTRASTPSDLLWRVKYIIPKVYKDDSNNTLTPKAPEKRFIIKGTNPDNDPYGVPYTNYRFTIWDVQEIQTWDRGNRDGEYYLTVLRSDIDKFVDGEDGSGFENSPYVINRTDSYDTIIADQLSELALNDRNYKVTSNVNYLYPSTNEEGNITNPRVLWNPPQTDSRVIVERMGSTGLRAKDVSVPNKKYYDSDDTSTPYHEVPALTSMTAEACHRLVHALDLCYIKSSQTTTTNVNVAPVSSWDDRSGKSTYNDISTNFNVYGSGGNAFRYGDTNLTMNNSDGDSNATINNKYGISGNEEFRKIPVCGRGISVSIGANDNNDSDEVFAAAPVVPLLRPSILRASSHTWEYVGIGPGNYSTGFPNLQTRVLKSYEQFIAQGYENAGGFVASSGTNSQGDFYIGNQVIQAGGQSTTTLNVPKVRKSSESNVVDIGDLENRISNNVINVIPSANKSSAQQDLLKGLSNFFTTARLTVTDRANIQTLFVTDRMFIANSSILNGEKFPEGGPEGYGFTKGARPEKTGFIATDTNDRLYVSPKYLDAWRIKKKILSASNINLDNNRIYVEPLSRTFIGALPNDASDSIALSTPIAFNGNISSSGVITISTGGIASKLYVGMKIAQVGGSNIIGEATIDAISGVTVTLSGDNATFTGANSQSFYAVDRVELVDSSGMPPFGRVDIEMQLEHVTGEDYILDGTTKFYLNPNINISLQYDEIDYTNNTLTLSSIQNFASYKEYIESVLPIENSKLIHTVVKNYSSVLRVINDDDELQDTKYLKGSLTSNVSSDIVTEEGTHAINTSATQIDVDTAFFSKLPTRGAITIRFNQSGTLKYSTYVYFKDLVNSKVCLLRKVGTQSSNDNNPVYTHLATGSAKSDIYFSGCETYISYGDKWTVESAFIPDVEEISEDVDIESATLYELPIKPAPYTGIVTTQDYTDSIVPNPVTSKALGANLQTKRTVKTFQPFESLKQVADFAIESGFTATDEVEIIMKPGYYRLAPNYDSEYDSNIKFPCKVKINGSGTKKTSEQYSKELANESAGRIGGYSLNTVKSGDSVSFFRTPQIRNNWTGRTDLLYISNINDRIESTGGMDIQNVHFLGINEAITRNEILDNSYSEDEYLVRSRRRVRKSWYVKQSKGFPSAESGITGGLHFHVNQPDGSATANGGKFTYVQKTDEFTDDGAGFPGIQTPSYDSATKMSKNSRYLKLTFDRDEFSSNEQRFNWLINYVIPGTTLHYIQNVSNANLTNGANNVVASTKRTRVLDVKKTTQVISGVTSVKTFDVFLALFDPTTNNSTADEDMDLVNPTTLWSADSLTSGIKCVFENRDGDEFVVLTYNWCKEKRYQLLPKDFTTSGEGFDPTEYDEPRIFGIIAGYRTDTLNLVIDTHPSAEVGAVKNFSRVGVAPTGVSNTYTNISATGGTGTGALFEVQIDNGKYTIKVTDGGQDYSIDDTLTIVATNMDSGFDSANNITITVGNVVPTREQYPAYNLFNFYPTTIVKLGNNDENYSFTLPVFPNGYRRLYGRQNTRYYLLEVSAKDIGALSDNTGHNTSISSRFSGFGYSDIDFDETTPTISVNIDGNAVTFTPQDRKRTSFTSDQQFEAIAKYNLWQSGFGYKEENPTTANSATYAAETVGRKLFMNYSQYYKVNRKKFPTSRPPIVGNLGATLIKVSGIPGSENLVTLRNVTIGAMSDANDISNTYGGAYHGGIISIENGQVDLRGVRFRGNLSLDWSGLLSDGASRLNASNKFTYGHSVDLLETSGLIKVNRFGDGKYSALNVSKDDINFKYYTMFRDDNNLYVEPSKLPTGVPVDYDQRTFPITTISAISKFNSSNTFNTSVQLDERYLTDEIYHDGGTPSGSYAGQTLRLNNSSQVTIADGVDGGHSDSSRDLLPKHITFTLPYSTSGQRTAAEEVAKNIVPNFTEIIREGNPDSILATVSNFEFYKKSNVAYFVIKYSGNIEYQNQQNTTQSDASGIGGSIDMSGFKLQLLTKYIPSQRFNYISTLTTRYIKRSNADGTQHSKYEIGFDDAQNISIFANSKDFTIEKVNGENNISRESSGTANILHFKKGTDADSINDVQVILETDATGNVISCDVVSLGLNNAKGNVLYYPSSSDQKYKITMATTVSTRINSTETDYEMFVPGEVVNTVENSSFIVNNFIETNLTGIKSALQKIKSIISPGSYIEYGGQYYKVAYSTPGRPYLGIFRYANPSNDEDIRTSLVVRLEEQTYNINYTRKRSDETITRFDLYEDDNILRYWPSEGRLEIGELETCDFTKQYINKNVGYRITLTRSNTKFWPSYIHDWDGLQIAESLSPSNDADNPAEAPPNISTGTITGTSIRLADPVDVTCSTYKRVKYYGQETVSSYMSKTGILTTNRAYIDIASAANQLDADLNKFEVGQIVSMPWRNLGIGTNYRGPNDKYNYAPSNIIVTVDDERGVAGTSGSTNREGDAKISIVITNTKEATQDIVDKTETTDGIARLSNNLRGGRGRLYQIVNSAARFNVTSSGDVYDKIDPLTTCRTTKSISSVLGKPHDDNNSVTIADVDATNRTFTVTQNGSDDNIGKGLVPGIVILKNGVLEKDTRISSVSRSGSINSYVYTIKFNKDIISGQTLSGTVTFTNAIYTDLEVFNPLLGTFTTGDTFQIVPQFNAEGHPWRRHTEVFTSRICDIEKKTDTIRLYLSDPFTFGDTAGNTYRDDSRFISETDSRHFGFISINHGGWSFPRSGGSYIPSNMVRTTNQPDQIKLLNRSGRIKAGDTIKYTYEANTLIQEINRSSSSDTNRTRFRFRQLGVDEGDSLIGLDVTAQGQYGVKDIYRQSGSYTVTHRRYLNKSGGNSDNYRFGNSSQNSFWNGTSFSTDAPITSYIKDGTEYFVDIGGGVATDATQDYTDKAGDGSNVDVTQSDLDNSSENLGVYTGTGTDQNTGDPFTRSLVRTNGNGKDAELVLTVSSNNEVTGVTINTKGTGYKVNDYIIVSGAVFNVDNPRYPKDLYLYISDVSTNGAIESFDPRFLLVNEEDSSDVIQIGYDSSATPPVWKIFDDPSDTAAESMTSTALADQQAIFIETVSGTYVYLKAQLPNAEGLVTYRVERVGGFTSGMKLIFAKPKPSAKLVTGTITNLGSEDADGYTTCTIDSPENILYNTFAQKSDWLSLSDVLVSHSSDLFANDGSVALRFMHSEFGGGIEFEAFRVWNDWYRNGSQNKGFGTYGSHGWVGNFGRTVDGVKPLGFTSTGSLSINWGRQRQNSIWKVAQPVRPNWTHGGVTSSVIHNGGAFTPAFRYFYSNGTNSFYSSSLLNYLMEDKQVFDSVAYTNPIKHISNTTDAINATVATTQKYLRDDWWSGRYYDGGMGPLSYQPYQWSSTFDSISTSRLVGKNHISYQLQDLRFRPNNSYGDINWGSGRNARLSEQIVMDYVQHYSFGPSEGNAANYFIDTGVTVELNPDTAGSYWENFRLTTNPSANGSKNIRQGRTVTSTVVGNRYIVGAESGSEYKVGQLFVASSTSLPSGVTSAYDYNSKIARGDAIYLSENGGTTKTFVGFVRYVGGPSGANNNNVIYLTQAVPTAQRTGDWELYYTRPNGLKTETFENAYSQIDNDDQSRGDNVLSAGLPGSSDYNLSFVIQKRNYNTSPILNTVGDVKPVGNFWWNWGTAAAHRSIRMQSGDLTSFSWSPMNINIKRFNPKVHLESAVTATAPRSTFGSNNIFI